MGNSKYFTAAAWLLGVQLILTAACSSTRTPGTQVADAAITAAVKAKLAADGDINPFNIDVDTNEGVVLLQGRVEKAEARAEAESVARSTDGVVRVINLLQVGTGTGGGNDPCYAPKCPCSDGTCSEDCCKG